MGGVVVVYFFFFVIGCCKFVDGYCFWMDYSVFVKMVGC